MRVRLTVEDFARLTLMGSAASKDAGRPILCGVNLETEGDRVAVTATNSYVLAHTLITAETDEPGDAIVAARSLKIAHATFKKVASRQMRQSPSELQVTVSTDGKPSVTLAGPDLICTLPLDLTEGKFPSWRNLIAQHTTEPVESSEFQRATKAIIVAYLDGAGVAVDDAWTKAILLEKVDRHYQSVAGSDDKRVALAPARLSEALGTLPNSDWVTFQMRTTLQPLVIRSGADKEWVALIMPVRV